MNGEENNNYSGDVSSEIVKIKPPVTPETAMMNNNANNINANMNYGNINDMSNVNNGMNNMNANINSSNPNMYGNGTNLNGMGTNVNGMNGFNTGNTMNMNSMNNYGMNMMPVDNSNDKKKKKWIIPIILGVLVLIIIAGGVTYKTLMSSPEKVFSNSVNSLYKEISKTLNDAEKFGEDFDITSKALIFKGDIRFDTDIAEAKELDINLGDYTLGGEYGIDLKNELLQVSAYVKGKSEKIDFQLYAQDDYVYSTSNLIDGMTQEKNEGLSELFDELKKDLEELKNNDSIDLSDYDYVLQVFKNVLLDSLDSKLMEKTNETVKVLDKEIKATKYSYVMNDKDVKALFESMITKMLDDKEFVATLAKITDDEESEVSKYLEEMKKESSEIKFDYKVSFNIYTNGLLNKTMGISLEVDNKELIHFYVDGGNFEFYMDDKKVYEDEYVTEYSGEVVKITGEIKEAGLDILLVIDDEKIATFTIKELSNEVIDVDYELIKANIKGSVYVSCKEEKDSFTGDYKFRLEYKGEFMSIEGSYGLELKDKLDKVNPSKIINEEDINKDDVLKKFEELANKDEALKKLYDYISENLQGLGVNEYGMKEVSTIDEAKNVLKKDKAVLYVGNPNVTIKASDELSIINSLKNVQNYYDFTSYYYDFSKMSPEFEQLVTGVTIECNGSAVSDIAPGTVTEPSVNNLPVCLDTPTIYFIKDGKVVSGIRGNITENDIMKKVEEIGYILAVEFDKEKEDI